MKRYLLGAALLFPLAAAAQSGMTVARPSSPDSALSAHVDVAAVDSAVQREMARQRIPGVAVAIVRGGTALHVAGYGFANLEHRVPVTDATMFQSGSLGKQFTSAGVMALVEEGALRLDESVRTYLPEAPVSWQPITIRHLLSHMSGIPDYTGDDFDYWRDYTEDDLLRMAYGLHLEFPAGARWNYSNTGYVVLGIIIHRVSGVQYWEFLRERVFDPARMTTIRVISERAIVPHRASGYQLVDGTWQHQRWVAPSLNTTADGSMLLSLRDMIAWNEVVRERRVLKPDGWASILTPATLTSGRPYPYGFGWFIDSLAGQVVHQHSGSWQGFATQFTRYATDDLAIIVLVNLGSANPAAIATEVAAALSPGYRPPALPVTPLTDDPDQTAFLRQVLRKASAGTLTVEDYAFVRQSTFPRTLERLKRTLQGLGAPERLDLLTRTEIGDDRRFVYRVVFRARRFIATLTRSGDGRLTGLAIRSEPSS